MNRANSIGKGKADTMGTKNEPSAFDCYANAEPDEPLFTLLARDESAPMLVELWAEARRIAHPEDPKIAEAMQCAHSMRLWFITKGKR